VLLSGMLCTIVWGRHRADKHGWGHFTPFAWLIGPPGLTAAFVAWQVREGRIHHPHIPLRLLRSRQFSSGVVMALRIFVWPRRPHGAPLDVC
jgi:hypothetical protein